MTKVHNPAELAAEYGRLSAAGTVCSHGVDRFERGGKLLVNFSEWFCACCFHVFQGDRPEGMAAVCVRCTE